MKRTRVRVISVRSMHAYYARVRASCAFLSIRSLLALKVVPLEHEYRMKPLLFFIKQLSAHKSELAIGIVLSITLAISSIALLSLSGWFISAAAFAGLSIATASAFNYFLPASMVRFLALIRIASRYADRVINHDYTFKILTQLRVWFYKKLIPLSPARLLSYRSGDLLSRLVHDIDTLDHLYLNIASPFLISCLMIIASAIFIAYFAKSVALINVSIILIAIIFICSITLKKAMYIGKKIQHAQTALRIQIIDSLQGFVDLLLFQTKATRESALDQQQKTLIDYQKKFIHAKAFIISTMALASGISIFSALWIGIPLVNQNRLNGAILAMIILLIIALYEQLMTLPFACLALGKTTESANRLFSIANQTPAVVFAESDLGALASSGATIAANQFDHALVFKNISFSYPDRHKLIIDNFSLTVSAGAHIGITGPSGFGKTTLLNLIARIFDPTTGNILLGNTDLKNFSETNLRQLITYVTQQIHIFNASVRDNITLFQPEIPDDLIWHELEKMDLANTMMKSSDGLNTIMGEFGKNFSGGQIRRIAIARALIVNAPILLLDEPSTGLENQLIDRIWKNCEKTFAHKTLIIATHEKQLLEKLQVVPL